MLHTLHYRQRLAGSVEGAWTFFSNPANLAEITPPWLDFRTTSELPPEIFPGLIITYRLRPLPGLAVDWVTEITRVCRPQLFVDEQRLGPYRFWHHLHRFSPVSGGVEVEDVIHYALPLWVLGEMLHRIAIRRRLSEIFEFRQRFLAGRFGTPGAEPLPPLSQPPAT